MEDFDASGYILSINSRSASVCAFVRDATILRFNLPVEPARTVGFGNQAASARERDLMREREIGCGIGDGESKDQGEEGIVNSLVKRELDRVRFFLLGFHRVL